MKAILLSIRPEHALNILNGDKTLELRKSVPKDFVGWVYVYVTKAKPLLVYDYRYKNCFITNHKWKDDFSNGTIPFRFWFDEYETLKFKRHFETMDFELPTYEAEFDEYLIEQKTCLDVNEIWNYGEGKALYAWHIKNLEIFGNPMELSEFRKIGRDKIMGKELQNVWGEVKRAPQSWQYVWVNDL